jgi:CheY-like chemotaxis protein
MRCCRARPATDAGIESSLEAIAQGGERASDLIRRILGFSRLHEPSRRPVQLGAVVTEATQLLRALLPPMVELRVDIARDCPCLLGDATALHQVVMNLGTNAWHALPTSGGAIRVRVEHVLAPPPIPELGALPAGPLLHLTVEDNGHGMDAATKARIFEPLFTTKPLGQGTGLGLAGVLSIITSHGGAVHVESEPGRGSCFSVWLPPIDESALDAPARDRVPAARERLAGRIVLVDDDPLTRAALERMLRHLGCSVEAYEDPREGLARVIGSPTTVDLVLTDLSMPAMRGDRLAAACREARADLPIVVLSGYLDDETRARLLADDVGALDKPPTLDGLGAVLGARLPRS